MKGKYVKTKFEKPLVIRQPDAFKSQRQSVLGKPATFSDSLSNKDFSKSKSVTTNNVSNDFSKPITPQILAQNVKSILKNTNVIAPGLYKVYTKHNQTRTPQLPQDVRKTNKRVFFSTGVIPTTSVSRPQHKSNKLEDRVMPNNSQGKKTKQPIFVPISTREPKRTVNQSVATPLKKIVSAKFTHQKPRSTVRKLYKHVSKTCNWWYPKFAPSMYKWEPKSSTKNVKPNLVEIILFIVDSGCSKHMTGNLKLLSNFVQKFLGTVQFGNDQIAPILGYGDLVQGNITIQRKSTCYVRDLKGNDLLTGYRYTYLYSITLQDTSTPNPYDIVTGLPKLKFVKDHLCSSCELGKAKRKSFKTKTTPSSKRRLQILHMDLCGPMRVESFNGKKFVLVIVDDYSRYTWTHFLRSKDETPEVLIDFLKLVQRGLHAQVRTARTNKGTEFLNKTLHAYFAKEGIEHQTSTARTPEQNGVAERRNRTLVEVAQTMLSATKVPLYFWAEAITTACFTQNRSLVIPLHKKTPYHIINGRKPSIMFFYIFGSLCYIIRDGENLDKMREKGDACIFVGYSTDSRAYQITSILTPFHNVRQRHLNMTVCPGHQSQENVPHSVEIVTTSNELDLLFSPMFDELLNGTTPIVSKSFDVNVADAPDKRQQQNTTKSSTTTVAADIPPLNIQTTPDTTSQAPTQAPIVTAT
ncbi:ribonuclease H-like domain-containing protein [Tanacetum coccineum]